MGARSRWETTGADWWSTRTDRTEYKRLKKNIAKLTCRVFLWLKPTFHYFRVGKRQMMGHLPPTTCRSYLLLEPIALLPGWHATRNLSLRVKDKRNANYLSRLPVARAHCITSGLANGANPFERNCVSRRLSSTPRLALSLSHLNKVRTWYYRE